MLNLLEQKKKKAGTSLKKMRIKPMNRINTGSRDIVKHTHKQRNNLVIYLFISGFLFNYFFFCLCANEFLLHLKHSFLCIIILVILIYGFKVQTVNNLYKKVAI